MHKRLVMKSPAPVGWGNWVYTMTTSGIRDVLKYLMVDPQTLLIERMETQ